MKFWQLEAIWRWHGGTALPDVLSDPKWSAFEFIFTNFGALVDRQDRDKLDREVPWNLAQAVLSRLTLQFSVNEGHLRVATEKDVHRISAVDAVAEYGGAAVEEVFEFGSYRIPT